MPLTNREQFRFDGIVLNRGFDTTTGTIPHRSFIEHSCLILLAQWLPQPRPLPSDLKTRGNGFNPQAGQPNRY